MDLPNKLLALANELAILKSPGFEDASHRRSVSTCYYALFHLLVADTAANWQHPETKASFGRLLDHGKMKAACEKKVQEVNKLLKTKPADSASLEDTKSLQFVAEAFIELHRQRTNADYDVSSEWSRTKVLLIVELANRAFRRWQMVNGTPEAQRFLFSLLAKDR